MVTRLLALRCMRLAVAEWRGRISPVFDFTRSVWLIDVEDGREVRRQLYRLRELEPFPRAAELVELGVQVLLCGAISAPLEAALIRHGIEVVGFVCGPVERVLTAYFNGELAQPGFLLPGCQNFGVRGGKAMFGRFRWRFGQGKGGPGGGAGRGGPRGAGPGGECVCPNCGEKVPHQAGQPCAQMRCPKCGTPMTRP